MAGLTTSIRQVLAISYFIYPWDQLVSDTSRTRAVVIARGLSMPHMQGLSVAPELRDRWGMNRVPAASADRCVDELSTADNDPAVPIVKVPEDV